MLRSAVVGEGGYSNGITPLGVLRGMPTKVAFLSSCRPDFRGVGALSRALGFGCVGISGLGYLGFRV